MAREEAINHLKTAAKSAIDSGYDSAVVDAVDMAREALEQEACDDYISRQVVLNILDDMVKDYIKENDFDKAQGVAWVKVQKLSPVTPQPKQEPCEDAISRQAVLEIVERVLNKNDALFEIEDLPYVQPQPKTGHWIRMKAYEKWLCSECNTVFRFTFKEHGYCPNCGAKMQEV